MPRKSFHLCCHSIREQIIVILPLAVFQMYIADFIPGFVYKEATLQAFLRVKNMFTDETKML